MVHLPRHRPGARETEALPTPRRRDCDLGLLRVGRQQTAPDRRRRHDLRAGYAGARYGAYGMAEGHAWVCVYADWGETIRAIRVRKANDREQRRYRDTPR